MESKLNNSIVVLLMQILHSHMHYNFSKLENVDMHPKQFPMLRLLYEFPGLNQREIAGKLNIKPPTVAVSIKRLEKAGFVERLQDEHNLRISRIYITEKGAHVMELGRKSIAEEEQMVLQGFRPEEAALLREYLLRIKGNLNQQKR